MTTIVKKMGNTYRAVWQFGERIISPLFMMFFSPYYLWHMLPTWFYAEPVTLGKFSRVVITFEAHPVLYVISALITLLGCLAGFGWGFSSLFNIRYFKRFFKPFRQSGLRSNRDKRTP